MEVLSKSTANVYLDGQGDLDITALDQGGQWTSGRIQSARTFGAAPGCELRVMAAVKLPTATDALGYWPAFWMLGPGQWPENGEIDVLEDINGLSDHSGAFHCGNLTAPNPDGTFGPCHEHTGISSGMRSCFGCMAGFRTYSVVVDRRDSSDERITWYLNGTEFFQVSESQVGSQVWSSAVDHGFSIILNLAMGGTFPNERCGCTTPTAQTTPGGTLSVRYVSVSAG